MGERAEYGRRLLSYLSIRLTVEFGKGFTERNLRAMRQFYETFPIRHALRAELTWSHYRLLMRVEEPSRREFYLTEGADSGWTSRQLERQINSFYYERLLVTQKENRPEIAGEIAKLEPKNDADYVLKDPYILEFLDLKENAKYSESELEQGLIDKLQEFLLELGKGFSFVTRQKRITTEHGEHYYTPDWHKMKPPCGLFAEWLRLHRLTHYWIRGGSASLPSGKNPAEYAQFIFIRFLNQILTISS